MAQCMRFAVASGSQWLRRVGPVDLLVISAIRAPDLCRLSSRFPPLFGLESHSLRRTDLVFFCLLICLFCFVGYEYGFGLIYLIGGCGC